MDHKQTQTPPGGLKGNLIFEELRGLVEKHYKELKGFQQKHGYETSHYIQFVKNELDRLQASGLPSPAMTPSDPTASPSRLAVTGSLSHARKRKSAQKRAGMEVQRTPVRGSMPSLKKYHLLSMAQPDTFPSPFSTTYQPLDPLDSPYHKPTILDIDPLLGSSKDTPNPETPPTKLNLSLSVPGGIEVSSISYTPESPLPEITIKRSAQPERLSHRLNKSTHHPNANANANPNQTPPLSTPTKTSNFSKAVSVPHFQQIPKVHVTEPLTSGKMSSSESLHNIDKKNKRYLHLEQANTCSSEEDDVEDMENEYEGDFVNFELGEDIYESDCSSDAENENYMDWNALFQHHLSQKDSKDKFRELATLARDFIYVAETYGRIIISEQFVSDRRKIIKPHQMGLAGGTKFICQNILFKFSLDVCINGTYLYGNATRNDEKAMKTASNELKGVTAMFQANKKLKFPLMALIHYRGYCLLAASWLPLKQLIYGSSDGGKTVKYDPNIDAIMKEVGASLNLQDHIAYGNSFVGPIDFEIHSGKEGEYYAIDFGRLLPPESPYHPSRNTRFWPGKSLFYNLLRSNFVKEFSKPLCSDGFSKFLIHDPNSRNYNLNLLEATEFLYNNKIPAFAKQLEVSGEKLFNFNLHSSTQSVLVIELHRFGLNCRHLGVVRSHLSSPKLKKLVLTECVARTLKHKIRALLRSKIATEGQYLMSVYQKLKTYLHLNSKSPSSFSLPISTNDVEISHETQRISCRRKIFTPYILGANLPIPNIQASFFFEITLEAGKNAMIGLLPVHESGKHERIEDSVVSHRYYSTGIIKFSSKDTSKEVEVESWEVNDKIGVFYNATQRFIIFTKNNKTIGVEFPATDSRYLPIIGIRGKTQVVYNFGPKFLFEIEKFCKGLNLTSPCLPNKTRTDNFWKEKIKKSVLSRFPNAVFEHEITDLFDLRKSIDFPTLLHLIHQQSDIELSTRILKIKEGEPIEVLESDIKKLVSRVKHMGIIEYAEAVYTLLDLESKFENRDSELSLLSLAEKKLSFVIEQTGLINLEDYYYWGCLHVEIARRHTKLDLEMKYLSMAQKIFQQVENVETKNLKLKLELWFKQGEISLKQKKYEEAKEKFKKVFNYDESNGLLQTALKDITEKIKQPRNNEILEQLYISAKIMWEASKKSAKLVEFYIRILSTYIYRLHLLPDLSEWKESALPLINELKNEFLLLNKEDLMACLDVFLNSTVFGVTLCLLLLVCQDSPHLRQAMETVIELNGELRVSHSPSILRKTLEKFLSLCESQKTQIILKQLIK